MKKYYWLLASYLPFILFMVWPFFRRDWPLFGLSIVSLFFLVTYIFNKKISYFDKSKGFGINWGIFGAVLIAALLNFFVIFLAAFVIHNLLSMVIIVDIVLIILAIAKSFNGFVKTLD